MARRGEEDEKTRVSGRGQAKVKEAHDFHQSPLDSFFSRLNHRYICAHTCTRRKRTINLVLFYKYTSLCLYL